MKPFPSLDSLSARIRSGETSAESLMNGVYDRIEIHDPVLNVYRSRLSRESALQRAKKIDARAALNEKLGVLAGIPVSVKDNICVSEPELTNSCASAILEEFDVDAIVVRVRKPDPPVEGQFDGVEVEVRRSSAS